MAGNHNSGRKPLPREIKQLRGTLQNCREQVPESPMLEYTNIPDPPPEFSEESRLVWFEVAASLSVLGVYTDADSIAFRMLVENVVITRDLNATDTARSKAYACAMSLMSRFGMEPASRTRVARRDGGLSQTHENRGEDLNDVPLFGLPLKVVGE